MAEVANLGAQSDLRELIAQFVDAQYVNRQIDGMFKPVVGRIQTDLGKKDFTLFSLFFDKAEVTELKKHVKDNITKLFAPIKGEKLLGDNVDPKSIVKNSAKSKVDVKTKDASVTSTKDVFDAHRIQDINIVGIDPSIIKQLRGEKVEKVGKAAEVKQGDGGSLLSKLLGAALAGFSAFTFLKEAWNKEGPLRGALELLGMVLTKASSLMFKAAIDAIKGFAKILPSSLLEKISGGKQVLGDIVGKMFSGVGKMIGAIGGTIMKAITAISPTAAKAITSVGGGLSKLVGSVGGFLAKRLKFLPFIGPLISIGFGIKRITDGDYLGGVIELLGGIVGFVPGMSFIAPLIADLFLAGSDIAGVTGSKSKGSQWIGDFGKAILELPPIAWLGKFGTALSDMASGNFVEGLTGLSDIIPGVSFILGLFGVEKNEEGQLAGGAVDVFEMVKNEIMDKIQKLVNIGKRALDGVRKFFGLDTKEKSEVDSGTPVELRTKLAELKAKEVEEQKKQYAFADTKVQNLNKIAAERSKLEKQVEVMDNKMRKPKAASSTSAATGKPVSGKVQANELDTAPLEDDPYKDPAYLQEQAVSIKAVSEDDTVDKVRQASVDKADNSDKVVEAIEDLKMSQMKAAEAAFKTPEPSAAGTTSIISNVNNNLRAAADVNIDTARDSVFLSRSDSRGYLYGQKHMI